MLGPTTATYSCFTHMASGFGPSLVFSLSYKNIWVDVINYSFMHECIFECTVLFTWFIYTNSCASI